MTDLEQKRALKKEWDIVKKKEERFFAEQKEKKEQRTESDAGAKGAGKAAGDAGRRLSARPLRWFFTEGPLSLKRRTAKKR